MDFLTWSRLHLNRSLLHDDRSDFHWHRFRLCHRNHWFCDRDRRGSICKRFCVITRVVLANPNNCVPNEGRPRFPRPAPRPLPRPPRALPRLPSCCMLDERLGPGNAILKAIGEVAVKNFIDLFTPWMEKEGESGLLPNCCCFVY